MGGFFIGFFDEVVYFGCFLFVQLVVQFDIVEIGFCCVWYYVEGNQVFGDGEMCGMFYCFVEGFFVVDQVICWYYYQYCCVIMFGLQCQGGDGNCWSGVVFGWFEDEMFLVLFQVGCLELVFVLEVMFVVGYCDDFVMFGQEFGGMLVGFVQQGLVIGQVYEWFWLFFV